LYAQGVITEKSVQALAEAVKKDHEAVSEMLFNEIKEFVPECLEEVLKEMLK
jgi:hypothetical protein